MNKFDKLKQPYNWQESEKNIYEMWQNSGYFTPENLPQSLTDLKKQNYTIILPPPNVTGTLHCGHALMLTIQDILIRHKRMQGYKTLWLPGTDHAAIATQSVVEKKIYKEEGKNRNDIGREEMIRRINDFALESQNTIISQFKDMGASLDWSRLAFTLDDTRNHAVNTMFQKMYNDGLIYQGHRIVNWDPKGQTTISDDELVYVEEETKFYYLKYGPFTIGTARPETKFGDKYVVMHPDDTRYEEYKHGQKIKVDWINGEIEATIIKDTSIDMEFGTGVMTITPSHSNVDFEIAQKYNLNYEQVIDKYGKLLPIAEEFAGQKIKDAREKIVEKLKSKNLLVREEKYTHNIATAERTGGIIEPQIMQQWFVAVNKEFDHFGVKTTLKKLMLEAVTSKDINIMPDRFEKVYFNWVNNLRDWCISRQIWYGHRVPVWYDENKNIISVGFLDDKYKKENGAAKDNIYQDEDTLDTWFSSGMWTFSTLNWPNVSSDMKNYHPTDVLETGYDIIFFWVARMIMMSKYALNQIPFKNVYLHGLVLDAKGKKMSKSVGNVLDPRDMIQKYGADALRMGMIVANGVGNDLRLSEDKIKAYRLFANKIWNANRFVIEKTEDYDSKNNSNTALINDDKITLKELEEKIKEIQTDTDNFRLNLASEKLYDYFWHQFCDVHIEKLKERIVNIKNEEDKKSAQKLLLTMNKKLLIALHPFMPFITEEIWSMIKDESENMLMVTSSADLG
jgi:valyl-tRNA synthetase